MSIPNLDFHHGLLGRHAVPAPSAAAMRGTIWTAAPRACKPCGADSAASVKTLSPGSTTSSGIPVRTDVCTSSDGSVVAPLVPMTTNASAPIIAFIDDSKR